MTTVRYQLTGALQQDALDLKKQYFTDPKHMNIDDYKRIVSYGAIDAAFKSVATDNLVRKASNVLVANSVDESHIRIYNDRLEITMRVEGGRRHNGGDGMRELTSNQVRDAVLANLSGYPYQSNSSGEGKGYLEIKDIWGQRSQIDTPEDFEAVAKADGDATKINEIEAVNALLDPTLQKTYVSGK